MVLGKRANGALSMGRQDSGSAPAATPVLDSLNYSQGDVLGGGEDIVITGTDLTDVTDVLFGEESAAFVVDGPTQITATLPAHVAGSVDVTVDSPGGTSNGLAFEFWAPTTEASCTLLLEAPDYDGTAWTARYDAKVGNTWVKTNAGLTAVPASGGAAAPAGAGGGGGGGDGTCGLKASTATWDDYLSATASTRKSGSVLEVASSTTTQQLSAGTPYNGPASICSQAFGVFGINHGNQSSGAGDKATMAYTHDDGDFNVLEVVHDSTALLCTITRAAAVASGGTHDLSINGAIAGDNYASTDGNGFTTAFGALNVLLFQKLDDDNATGQDFAGLAKAYSIFNVKISDAVLTKCYKWSQQRHGV